MNIEDYKKSVEILAKTESKLIFKNSNHNHASVVLTNLFKASKHNICIYDTDLSGDIADLSNDFITAIIEFVRNGSKKLKIIVKEPCPTNYFQTLLFDLMDRFPTILSIRLANQEIKENVIQYLKTDLNFAVGDLNKFRLEYSESGERKAYCSFNNNYYSKSLVRIFNSHFNNCKQLKNNA